MTNYITDIKECTIDRWNMANDGDLTALRLDKGTEEEDILAYFKLQDNFIEYFGRDSKMTKLIDLKKKLISQCISMSETGKANKINIINITLQQIEKIETELGERVKGDIFETLIHLGKWNNQRIDIKVTTVMELYTMIKIIEKENGKNN